ncbi:hypothetical protein, partial [Lactobacillus mulieris]
WLTQAERGREGEGMIFNSPAEATMAYANGDIHFHTRIGLAADSMPEKTWPKGYEHGVFVTTYGKMIFNQIFPKDFFYVNDPTQENLTHPLDVKY